MGKGCESSHWHYPWQLPNLNCENAGQSNVAHHPRTSPVFANPCCISASGIATESAAPVNYRRDCINTNEFQAWYSHYPHGLQQSLVAAPKSIFGEKHFPCGSEVAPIRKQFLIFDQSGNQTSLIFSSVGYPSQYPFSSSLKLSDWNVSNVALPVKKDASVGIAVEKAVWYELDEKREVGVSGGSGSEMREDTEELDALLSSDDEEEEETSTGHSPSEVTGYENKGVVQANKDEVARSVTAAKRKRMEEVDLAFTDTASSGNELGGVDEKWSSSVKGGEATGVLSMSKRVRRETLRRTVSILRSIIPSGGKGKDAMVVLDEAIQYLKCMRLKAKALGAVALM